MWNSINEYLNDNCFGNCNKCGELTSKHKLEEFTGLCEDCFYNDKEEN